MEIRMRTLSAGPQGVRQAGKKYNVETAEANELIAGGFAVPAVAPSAKAERPAKVEHAVPTDGPETATGIAMKGAPQSRARKPVK